MMESPSAQLVDGSYIDGPPSSPFVSEMDGAQSRSPSKQQWRSSDAKRSMMDVDDLYQEDDKENLPQQQQDSTLARMFASPTKKHATPDPAPPATSSPTHSKGSLRSSSNDADLMPPPPPSTRKNLSSPRKTPLRSSGSRTPKSLRRGQSFERNTPSVHSVSAFQAGLDMRDAAMPIDIQPEADDTCYSAFSEVPDMTLWAKLGQSPTKRSEVFCTPRGTTEATPRTSRKRSSESRSPSPTPRRAKTPAFGNKDETTSFLIDFTQQFEGVPAYRSVSPGKMNTEPNLLQFIHNQRSPGKSSPSKHYHACTPNKQNNNLLNLLDFELPPAPTPRSIPTITVRELESLKSSYLSQISSLKATLSGREAEVDSLKKAVGDAERRVGEAQEALREERNKREYAEQDIAGWKKRGQEFEVVLKSVKEEVMKSETEKDEAARRLEEAEKRAEEAETRAVKAEERYEDALAARASNAEGGDVEEQVQRLVSAQIDSKIEAVSRELHSVYKEKHERKVGTLKKSYEARNEKKTAELQSRVAELEKTNEELQVARDATFSGPVSEAMLSNADNVELKAQLEEQKASLARMETEMQASRSQQDQLIHELQQERIEKGDLVAAVDEMLALQAEAPPTPGGARALSVVEDFRKSISRAPPSGLRAPGSAIAGGESRIGRSIPTPGANRNGGGMGFKSKMLANIERMGRTNSGQSQESE